MIERQELYCHNCGRYVQFPLDLSMDGKYTLNCPNCGHEHYRFVHDGIISDERWQSSGGFQTFQISPVNITITTTASSDTNWRTFGSWGATNATSGTVFTWTGS